MDKQDIAESKAQTMRLGLARAAVIVPLVLYAGIAVFAALAVLALQPLVVYLLWMDDYLATSFSADTNRGLTVLFTAPLLAAVIPGALALLLGLKEVFRNLLRSHATDAPLEVRHRLIMGIILIYVLVSLVIVYGNPEFGSAYLGTTAAAALMNIRFALINRNIAASQLVAGILLAAFVSVAILVANWILLLLLDSSVAAYLSAFGIAGAVLIVVSAVAGGRWLHASREYLVAVAVLLAAICAAAAAIVLGLGTRAGFAESSSGSFFLDGFIWVIAATLLLQQLAFILLPFLLVASARYARLRRERDAARRG